MIICPGPEVLVRASLRRHPRAQLDFVDPPDVVEAQRRQVLDTADAHVVPSTSRSLGSPRPRGSAPTPPPSCSRYGVPSPRPRTLAAARRS
eukprot:2730337-Pyramimonas_sp.AAC.1